MCDGRAQGKAGEVGVVGPGVDGPEVGGSRVSLMYPMPLSPSIQTGHVPRLTCETLSYIVVLGQAGW